LIFFVTKIWFLESFRVTDDGIRLAIRLRPVDFRRVSSEKISENTSRVPSAIDIFRILENGSHLATCLDRSAVLWPFGFARLQYRLQRPFDIGFEPRLHAING
jgi:hypothetical protein